MKLDDLLNEYRAALPAECPVAFADIERRRRWPRWPLWLAAPLAAAAVWLFLLRPAPVRVPVTVTPAEPALNGFVALTQYATLPAPDTVHLVRVNISGQRLLTLGVLNAGTPIPDRLLADVLVGNDGMPRAIRVLEQ